MQQTLFDDIVIETKNNIDEIGLVLSKTMSNKSKTKTDFQKSLEKNKHLQAKFEYVKMLSLYSNTKIHELLYECEEEYAQTLFENLKKLDECYNNRLFKFTKKRKEKLREIIFEKAIDVLEDYGIKEANEYYEKYKPSYFDEEMNEHKDEMKHRMKDIFGLDLDMDDFDGVVDEAKLHEKYAEQFEQFQNGMNETFASFGSNRKKSKKEIARDEKRKADEKLLENDVQKLFKELVVRLHPDKEMNEALKVEKEELFKLVNKARDEDDIYELLRIRMLVSENDATVQELVLNNDTLVRLTKLVREKNKMLEVSIFQVHNETNGLNKVPSILMDEEKMKVRILESIEERKREVNFYSKMAREERDDFSRNNKFLNEFIDFYVLSEGFEDFEDFFDF